MANDNSLHRSTERILDILLLVAANPARYTQTQICQKLEAPKSSLFPMLHTLTAREFLAVDTSGHYRLGRSACLLGSACLAELSVLDEVEHILKELTAACGETSHFAVLHQGNVLYLKKIDTPALIRMTSQVGMQMPAYGTALGKALLLDYDTAQLRTLYPNGLQALTPNTVSDILSLRMQLDQAGKTGFTCEIEESTPYIRCFAVPIRKNGRVQAAISVAIPTFRYTDALGEQVISQLQDVQRRVELLFAGADLSILETEAERLG